VTRPYLWRGEPGLAVLNAAILAARHGRPFSNDTGFEWPAARSRGVARCGTERGYRQHLRAPGREPCARCRAAHNGYKKRAAA